MISRTEINDFNIVYIPFSTSQQPTQLSIPSRRSVNEYSGNLRKPAARPQAHISCIAAAKIQHTHARTAHSTRHTPHTTHHTPHTTHHTPHATRHTPHRDSYLFTPKKLCQEANHLLKVTEDFRFFLRSALFYGTIYQHSIKALKIAILFESMTYKLTFSVF